MGIQGTWQATLSKIGSLELVEEESLLLEQNQEVSGERLMGELEKGIRFEEVSFAYSEKAGDVLRKVSLNIPAKSTVAFVGESGAGKSTLIDMLSLLLRPRQGRVLIDEIDGAELDLNSWRRQIGYVSQETVIFDDTVANNISLWKTDYTSGPEARSAIEKAAKQAFADRFIQRLPGKYETKVGDRGVRLSGGQRQRLFLARELYKNPRLLILDEATSALDSESEKFIQESIESLKGRMTVVIIAHRLSTIRHADKIVVLKDGQVNQCGTYEELMGKSAGDFARMVELQTL
jgi:subfamily B ATP-binding cassette protein MsbA